jgi:hypothetical protein
MHVIYNIQIKEECRKGVGNKSIYKGHSALNGKSKKIKLSRVKS